LILVLVPLWVPVPNLALAFYSGSDILESKISFKNIMTTITLSDKLKSTKTHFDSKEELYLLLQEQIIFEKNLQLRAQKAMELPEEDIVDIEV